MEFLQTYWKKLTLLFASFIVIVCIFNFNFDIQGKEQIDMSFTQSVVVFGSAKALNAVISLAQGTEVDLPFFTIAIGEMLDPINDLIEQFSLVMLASMVSLGIQKIMLNFVATDAYNYILLSCIAVLNIWIFLGAQKYTRFSTVFFKLTVVLIFLRFALPMMGLVNEMTYNSFVKQDYNIEQLNEKIVQVKEDVNNVTIKTMDKKESSFVNKIVEKFDTTYYSDQVNEYEKAVDNSSEYIVALIIVFIFQTILFPLIFLFFLYYSSKAIFRIEK
jgi:hypothetical protein